MYEENFHKLNPDIVESSYTINNEWFKELLQLFIYLLDNYQQFVLVPFQINYAIIVYKDFENTIPTFIKIIN